MYEIDSCEQNDQPSFFTEGLWEFGLRYYKASGIEDACLNLQNNFFGNVLLLLWNKWLDQQQLIIDTENHKNISNFIELQSECMLMPLRSVRKHLSDSPLFNPVEKQQQKDRLLADELAIEKELLAYLQRKTASYSEKLQQTGVTIQSNQPMSYTENYLISLHVEKALQRMFTEPFM